MAHGTTQCFSALSSVFAVQVTSEVDRVAWRTVLWTLPIFTYALVRYVEYQVSKFKGSGHFLADSSLFTSIYSSAELHIYRLQEVGF